MDAYFSRIDWHGPREPSLAALQAVCAAQTAAIAFENLDPFLGRTPELNPEALRAKLVEQKRGGYCFELNALLRDALLSLGMQVDCLAARVLWMAPPDTAPRPRTHMLLRVRVSDQPQNTFIADAGFGGQLFGTPLLFEPGLEQVTPDGSYRIHTDGSAYTLETSLPDGWMPLYRFTLEPHLPVDYEPANWFTATHPASIFRHNLLIQVVNRQGRTGLLNDRLVTSRPGERPEIRRIQNAADFAHVLDEVFGIVPPMAADEVFTRIPKGLDGMVTPSRQG